MQFNSLVTGGCKGIGRSIVDKLLERSDNVFVFDCLSLNDSNVQELIKIGVKYFNVDISSTEKIKFAFQDLFNLLDSLPNSNLNILVNNAGVTKDNLAIRMSEADWDFVLDVNLKGAFFCCQHAIKRMLKQQNGGYIINMSSIVGKIGNIGQANYAASKAGLIAVTKSLAAEYSSRNILINAIAPGFIKTAMTDKLSEQIKDSILQRISLKKFGSVQDVANLVEFLSSGRADYISGAVIDLNGGLF